VKNSSLETREKKMPDILSIYFYVSYL